MNGIKIISSSKKVILTGATGLIGKETVLPLKNAGFDIYALTIDKNNPNPDINWIDCNVFDSAAVKKVFNDIKPQYLLNFAWATTDDYLTSNINFNFLKSGIEMLEYFAENGGKRAVYSGTCFEYEFKDELLKEDDPVNPQTVYAKCKNSLRELSELYCKNNGISFGWGRIFYVFGHEEHKKRLTPYIIDSLRNNKEVTIKNGTLIRDYMYSRDIANAFVKFLASNTEGIINICSGKGISIADFSLKIADKLNKTQLIKVLNVSSDEPEKITGSNKRLTDEIGYTPEYTLDEALYSILNSRQQNKESHL